MPLITYHLFNLRFLHTARCSSFLNSYASHSQLTVISFPRYHMTPWAVSSVAERQTFNLGVIGSIPIRPIFYPVV